MMKPILRALVILAAALAAPLAVAAPVLKSDVVVKGDIVTAGDMFADAGSFAAEGLFRSPQPGTAGTVGIDAVRQAAALVGLTSFDDAGITSVRVARSGVPVDADMLNGLIQQDLKDRGVITAEMGAEAEFDMPLGTIEAAAVDTPVRLVDLRYIPGSAGFSASFAVAGLDKPLDLVGRLTLMIPAPFLAGTLPAGAILTSKDIDTRMVPQTQAQSAAPADTAALIGKQLLRQSRAGMMLRLADVTEPQVVGRNDTVTVYFHEGPLTLSVKGQALNAAAKGDPVAVLNTASHKILHGTAVSSGAVEIDATPLNVAGL